MIHVLAKGVLLAVLTASAAFAEPSPQVHAKLAIEKLDGAAQALTNAPKARDRVRALIKTVRAYEAGLDALRSGMRDTALREAELQSQLAGSDQKLAALLGALLVQQQAPEAALLLHPSGPVATARAGMLLSEAAPALQKDTAALRQALQELQQLRTLQAAATAKLTEGLLGAQEARTTLSLAVAERGDLPKRFTADPQAMRLLLESSETLEGFTTALGSVPRSSGQSSVSSFTRLRGVLPLPVRGSVLRGFNRPDAAGIVRPGLILSTVPRALVTTPVAATVRYQGPLLDYGHVIILEPQQGYLLVLAGLGEVFVEAGQVVPEGDVLALMGGDAQITQGFEEEYQQDGGNPSPETLYIEVRDRNTPVDPTAWFKVNKD